MLNNVIIYSDLRFLILLWLQLEKLITTLAICLAIVGVILIAVLVILAIILLYKRRSRAEKSVYEVEMQSGPETLQNNQVGINYFNPAYMDLIRKGNHLPPQGNVVSLDFISIITFTWKETLCLNSSIRKRGIYGVAQKYSGRTDFLWKAHVPCP